MKESTNHKSANNSIAPEAWFSLHTRYRFNWKIFPVPQMDVASTEMNTWFVYKPPIQGYFVTTETHIMLHANIMNYTIFMWFETMGADLVLRAAGSITAWEAFILSALDLICPFQTAAVMEGWIEPVVKNVGRQEGTILYQKLDRFFVPLLGCTVQRSPWWKNVHPDKWAWNLCAWKKYTSKIMLILHLFYTFGKYIKAIAQHLKFRN